MAAVSPRTDERTGIQMEGFAKSLARALTGKNDPKVVRFLYDWQLSVEKHGHYSPDDPFNVKRHGEFKNAHAARVGAAHMLHAPRFQSVTRDLERGDTAHARRYMSAHGMHLPTTNLPVALDAQGDTKTKAGNWADNVSGGVGDALGGLGDIGGWIGKNAALLVILLVVVVLVAKK